MPIKSFKASQHHDVIKNNNKMKCKQKSKSIAIESQHDGNIKPA